ncbi:MAG TPA: isoaspartyl peptidase/L-asparaginase [Methylomirabilota bacterium]|nr:isoaspartyl peptidase/L-asparaginase [Methylomirabilota bacterium]
MLLVGSENAAVGFPDGMRVLRRGGRALDAVEAAIRRVESNPADHSVGYGGLPNILGEVELDASIMDGRSLEAGAVCAVRGYEHVISLARQVMRRLPHVFLAGAGAEHLARELGMRRRRLLTARAQATFDRKITPELRRRHRRLHERVSAATQDPQVAARAEDYFGTVNVIAVDRRGDIASGVSTSGWAWKYPGRVGDSPVIGAGNYADNRHGACACTGYGEMAIRCGTARSLVLYLKMGLSLEQAGREAMIDLRRLTVPFPPRMNFVAVDARGRHLGMTTETAREVRYAYQASRMTAPAVRPRLVVPLAPRSR